MNKEKTVIANSVLDVAENSVGLENPMKADALEGCTKTETAEHARYLDEDSACDDYIR